MRNFCFICLLLITARLAFSQTQGGFIPEELLRPSRGEAPRYPVDTVIGELGQGRASASAYTFADVVVSALFRGRLDHPVLKPVSVSMQQSYMSALEMIEPKSYRIGGGREEADGAVSFMVRFIGRDYGITGELFIRFEAVQTEIEEKLDDELDEELNDEPDEELAQEPVEKREPAGNWIFEDLILEEASDLNVEQIESRNRYDFSPYERFF